MVDVTVTEGSVPSPGLRLCLPVEDAVRDAARGRPLPLLHEAAIRRGIEGCPAMRSPETHRRLAIDFQWSYR